MENSCTTIKCPGPFSAHTSVYFNSYIYIFGGWDGKKVSNELLQLDLKTCTWLTIECENTAYSRNKHASAVLGNELFLHGGNNGKIWLDDVSSMDLNITKNKKVWDNRRCGGDIPSPRGSHTLTVFGDVLYAFGGFDGITTFDSLHVLQPLSRLWTKVRTSGSLPPARSSHAAVCLTSSSTLVIHGGLNSQQSSCNHLHLLNIHNLTWSTLKQLVPAISGHIAFPIANDFIATFGGKTADGLLSQGINLISVSNSSQDLCKSQSSLPNSTIPFHSLQTSPYQSLNPRHRHSIALIPADTSQNITTTTSRVAIIGGVDENSWLPNCIIFDPQDLYQLTLEHQTNLTATTALLLPKEGEQKSLSVSSSKPTGVRNRAAMKDEEKGPSREEVLSIMSKSWLIECGEHGRIPIDKYGYVKKGDMNDLLVFGRGIEAVGRGEGVGTPTLVQVMLSSAHILGSLDIGHWKRLGHMKHLVIGWSGIQTANMLGMALSGVVSKDLQTIRVIGDGIAVGISNSSQIWARMKETAASLGGVPRMTITDSLDWGCWKNRNEMESATGRKQLLRSVKTILEWKGLFLVDSFNGLSLLDDEFKSFDFTSSYGKNYLSALNRTTYKDDRLVQTVLERIANRRKAKTSDLSDILNGGKDKSNQIQKIDDLVEEGRFLQGLRLV